MEQDLFTDAEIPDQMRAAHKLSYEKKKADPERQARLNNDGPSVDRSEQNKYEKMPVPKLETLKPFWNCYRKADAVQSSDLFTYVQAYCQTMLRVKFKEIEDMEYALTGTYKAVVGAAGEHGQTHFVIRMVEFQEKTLFVMYLQRSENSTVVHTNRRVFTPLQIHDEERFLLKLYHSNDEMRLPVFSGSAYHSFVSTSQCVLHIFDLLEFDSQHGLAISLNVSEQI